MFGLKGPRRHIAGFGQAIPDDSSISWKRQRVPKGMGVGLGGFTVRGVLERERNHVLDTLNGNCEGVTRKALANDDFDPTDFIRRAPVVLA